MVNTGASSLEIPRVTKKLGEACEECGGGIIVADGEPVCSRCGLVYERAIVHPRYILNEEGNCDSFRLYVAPGERLHMVDGLGSYIDYPSSSFFKDASGIPLPPHMQRFYSNLKRLSDKRARYYRRETKLALLRRIKPLTEGQAGMALNVSSAIDLESLLQNFVSIELGHFKEEEVRKIFTSILLKLIYDYRTERAPSKLQHVTVIEESRSIVPARRLEDPPSIGERMISELRKFGEGVIIISQFPTQISREIVKNAATRICHEVKTEDDQAVLKGAMKLTDDQASYLHYLKPGEAIINLPLIPHAFHVYVEPDRTFSQISDDQLKSEMQRRFYGKAKEIELQKPKPTPFLSRLAVTVKLCQLLRKYEKLNLNQIQEAMGLSAQAFFLEVLPCLDELITAGKVVKFLGEDGKNYYRSGEGEYVG